MRINPGHHKPFGSFVLPLDSLFLRMKLVGDWGEDACLGGDKEGLLLSGLSPCDGDKDGLLESSTLLLTASVLMFGSSFRPLPG